MDSTRPRRRLARAGALLRTTHDTGGEPRVRLRLARPSDARRVRSFLEALAPGGDDAAVRHFTFYDPRERVVVVATAPLEGTEKIVGLADVELLETSSAEVGVVVDDELRGRGVGTLLTEAVAALAIQKGATRLKARLLGANAAMLRIMERLGPSVRTREDDHTVVYTRLPDRRSLAA
jgi:RimJ/RimL family protein N-acetyltransferase